MSEALFHILGPCVCHSGCDILGQTMNHTFCYIHSNLFHLHLYALLCNPCASSKKSSMQLPLHAWVLHESRQYSPLRFVNSGIPAHGSLAMCLRAGSNAWCSLCSVSVTSCRLVRKLLVAGTCYSHPFQVQQDDRTAGTRARNNQVASPTRGLGGN